MELLTGGWGCGCASGVVGVAGIVVVGSDLAGWGTLAGCICNVLEGRVGPFAGALTAPILNLLLVIGFVRLQDGVVAAVASCSAAVVESSKGMEGQRMDEV